MVRSARLRRLALAAALSVSPGALAAQTAGPGGFSVGGAVPGVQSPTGEEEQALAPVAGVSVTLQGLDKLTGEVQPIEIKVGESTMFGRMKIEVRACYARTAARAPESSVFLQISDTKPVPPKSYFSGWMFASSPALSAMDHPRYDVWVLSCKTS